MSGSLTNDWIYFFVFVLLIGFLLTISDLLLKRLHVNPHTTRRVVHILVGIYVIFTPYIFLTSTPILVLALIFIILNYLGVRYSMLPGIHSTSRLTYGTVYFPLSFLILVLWFWEKDPAILITAMLIMALGDPIASWVGESRKNPRSYRVWTDTKSFQGSLAMFVIAYLMGVIGMYFGRLSLGGIADLGQIAFFSLFVAAYATMSETVSHQGTDNLTVPLGAGLMLDFMFHSETAMVHQLMLWMLITTAIAWLAYRMKTLSLSGAVGAWLLGTIVFGIGGTAWIIPMAAFFILSSLFSKLGKKHKEILNKIFEKGSNRDFFQVYANGGIAGAATILYYFTGNELWFVAFLGSLAAATADTWGTELGTFSKTMPRSILTFEPVAMGRSGGITVIGTGGAFLGALTIAALGVYSFNGYNGHMAASVILLAAFSGFAGALVDSLLGATLQAHYRCPSCGKLTEKKSHCGIDMIPHVQGLAWMNNDWVNLICTVSGGLLAIVFYLLFF
ncbi:MAG TPA: DUF92 domain-containing protein [Candidatus Marinimicrobia bacterium]|nr:DUF92 domain-containing protein [Candidatus Neomarinimicrobiota bacterium]